MVLVSLLGVAAADPRLYFYPSPARLSDGSIISSPVTVEAAQLTTNFPAIREMDGVALIVYWSQLCPAENRCDFSLIDEVLSYWRSRGKRVVLGVATVGYPLRTVRNGVVTFETATPAWLLSRIIHYETTSRTLDVAGPIRKISAQFPSYSDPHLVAAIKQLVDALAARFDGNPAIAQVRISTGLLTEDNPSVDGLRSAMPGFSDAMWTSFCRAVADIYLNAFKKTQLEFDVGRISWTLAGWHFANGHVLRNDQHAMAEARSFIEYLIGHRVFVAFNGLSAEASLPEAKGSPSGVSQSLQILLDAKQHGLPVGLEAMSPIYAPRMRDTKTIGRIICAIKPDRLVYFAVLPALLNYERRGSNEANKLLVKFYDSKRLNELMQHANSFIQMTNTERYCRSR